MGNRRFPPWRQPMLRRTLIVMAEAAVCAGFALVCGCGGTADAPIPTVDAGPDGRAGIDRKSTRLNSSHLGISYAVFCFETKEPTSEFHSFRYIVCRPLRSFCIQHLV